MRGALMLLLLATLAAAGCLRPDDREDTPTIAPGRTALQPEQQFEEAFICIMEEKFEQAIPRLDRIVAADRGGSYADDALFWQGYCRAETGRIKEAAEAYRALLASFPESSYAPLAAEMLKVLPPLP